jgi:non-ribosomal peptide synthetase-like protein
VDLPLADIASPPPIAPAAAPYDTAPHLRDELLHEVFGATAAAHPDRTALALAIPDPESTRRSALTYAELRDRAAQFARHLVARGVRRGDRVVICLPRGLDQYMALLGVLEAGAAYVPVDWSTPQERVDYITAESEAFAVVTTEARAPDFPAGVPNVIAVDAALGDVAALSAEPLTRADTGAEPGDAAYLIYTSGSTGRPKGVVIRHCNVCFQIRSEASILGVTADDRVYAGASLAFDISVEEMWAAFLNGAELLVGDEQLAKAGPDLAQTLEDCAVTVWCPVPSLLAVLDRDVASARIVNVGGEACPPELVRRWARPGRRMLNTYGPTETTVTATWTELKPGKPVTIGTPLPGFTAWIVDAELMPVAAGTEGELVIGGPALALGYLHREELTAEKFVAAPFPAPDGGPHRLYRTGDLTRLTADGEIDFLGRIDTQVKIRGYRVELGEIESAIADDPAVAQAVVNLYRDDDGSEVLVAFIAARGGMEVDLARIRATLTERLPAYMRPAAYEVRASLPTLVSGKVDRKALARPERIEVEARTLVPPATPSEEALLAAWREALAHPAISVEEDFFEDLGGHSLKAARMVSLARATPALASASIQDLYAAPTIRKLAARLDAARPAADAAARARPPELFHPIPQLRRTLCVIAQTIALVPIFAAAGVQWIFPYLAYTALASDTDRVLPLLVAGAAFVVMPPLVLLLSIAVKWLVIGRYREGDYPLWGAYYFRWWFVRRFLGVVPVQFLAGTPIMRVYYRLLGAKIGARAYLGLDDIDAADLVSIGEGAVISEGAVLATVSVERGLLRIGRVEIGAHAHLGAMSVVGRGASVGANADLQDLSALPAGERVPDGESWTGSPAIAAGPAAPRPPVERPSRLRVVLVNLGLLVAAPLLPLAAVIPIAPGLIAMIELDWRTSDYTYMALSPVLALAYVIAMCLLTVVVKWALLGRVKPGRYSLWSWFYVRFWFVRQLGLLALELLHPLYATLYVKPWYRALGAKVGARAEVSTATSVVHDLIDIGEESFVADGVVFGAPRAEAGVLDLQPTRIGKRSFIGNSGLLPTGADVGDEVLIGVLSKPPEPGTPGGGALETGSTWFGSPAIRLPRRQSFAVFDEGARFRPSKRLIATRLAIEYVRITLSLTVFIALFSAVLSITGDLSNLKHGALWIALAFPFLYVWFAVAAGAFVVALKWLVIGRYEATTAPLWSLFVWKTELVTSTYENLVVPLLLEPLRGTPWINVYLRLMGCRIGRRVFTDTTDITEHDLVTIGDDAALNENAGLQTHLFEDRVMKVSGVDIGARATVGSLAIVLYDAVIEPDAQLGDLSVLMKGERLPAATSWEGSPARPARG